MIVTSGRSTGLIVSHHLACFYIGGYVRFGDQKQCSETPLPVYPNNTRSSYRLGRTGG